MQDSIRGSHSIRCNEKPPKSCTKTLDYGRCSCFSSTASTSHCLHHGRSPNILSTLQRQPLYRLTTISSRKHESIQRTQGAALRLVSKEEEQVCDERGSVSIMRGVQYTWTSVHLSRRPTSAKEEVRVGWKGLESQ